MTEIEIFEKYNNLSEDELNAKSNKNVHVENDIMTTVIKRCRGEEKKRRKKIKNRWIQEKVNDSRAWNSRVSRTGSKLKIGKIFVNEKILEKYSVKIYKIDPYFCEHYKEKIQVDKNGCEYILFRIDVYFTEYLLAVEIDEKTTCLQRPYFWGEKTKSTRILVVNLLEMIQVSVTIKIMKLEEYKLLSVNLKTDK